MDPLGHPTEKGVRMLAVICQCAVIWMEHGMQMPGDTAEASCRSCDLGNLEPSSSEDPVLASRSS